ncbi:hypothetical protein [Streptomyces sp. NPDC058735]|uniref:hypothetical protein n=1 Tax=unclassified Streptomyces TaxID=2593676 RepID=UPI00368C5690
MPVSAATEKKLREAMARLLAGEPLHTDGALTKENLAREAKISHATVHRAEEILAEWDARVARPVLRTPGEVQRDETIADLRKRLREATARATKLQGKLDGLARVTAKPPLREPRAEEEDFPSGTAPDRRPAGVGPLAGVTPQAPKPSREPGAVT